MSDNKNIAKAAGVVGAATFLSRIFGFVRDVVIASFFGAGIFTDAFFVAFRIPNLMRRLFAEGSLSIAFVPVFTDYLTNHGKEEAFNLARSGLRMLLIILFIVVVIGILMAPIIIRLIAPGFISSYEKLQLTVQLTRIMFPYVIFICLVALSMGILNVLGHFIAPAIAPVFLNIAMISSVFFISPIMEHPVTGLAIGVLIGGILQLVIQIPPLIKRRFYFWKKSGIYHPGLKKIGKLMIPALIGAAVYQINIVVGTLLASLLDEGSVSWLYYADRLVQFPLAIFAISTATAVLPTISKQAAKNDLNAVKDTFSYGIRFIFFITIPAMTGLIILREPIITLLFQRGAFDVSTTKMTAIALLYYSLGLWAFSAVRIVVATFYALSDTKTPMKMAIISIIVNIICAILLMIPLAHGGLALATSISSMLNFFLLVKVLGAKIGHIDWKNIIVSIVRSVFCSLIMGGYVYMIALFIIFPNYKNMTYLLSGIVFSIISAFLLYGGISFLLKAPELESILFILKKGQIRK